MDEETREALKQVSAMFDKQADLNKAQADLISMLSNRVSNLEGTLTKVLNVLTN